jgi:hypothetical protein
MPIVDTEPCEHSGSVKAGNLKEDLALCQLLDLLLEGYSFDCPF